MQAVKLTTEPEAFVGTSTVVKNIITLHEDTKIFWAGSRIYAKRPCGRDIVISKTDIFCEGQLEKGEYIREKTIPISNRVPPTIKERNLSYQIRSEISMIKPGTRAEEEFFFAENPIVLKVGSIKISEAHPIDVSIKGIKIHIDKDHFQPSETIKIDYELEKSKDLKIDLVKDANILCYCPDYASTCIHINPKPPTVEKVVKASNLITGILQLPLPSSIELSHRYVWEPAEKIRWKETFGDYVKWFLEVISTLTSDETVKFQIPINIMRKQTPEEIKLFVTKQTKAKILQNILVPDSIKIINQDTEGKRLTINFKNNSKEILNGVTIKIIPIESEFFELPPNLTGVNEWKPDTEIQVYHNHIGKNIKNLQILVEDNKDNSINKRINL